MDPEKAQRLLWTLAALGFAMAILGAVGELLGWWSDAGQALVGLGTLVGVVMSSSSVLLGSSSEQVAAIRSGQERTHDTLGSMAGRLASVDGKLDSMDGKLDKLEDLDVIQAELDRQTGALDRQIEILETAGRDWGKLPPSSGA